MAAGNDTDLETIFSNAELVFQLEEWELLSEEDGACVFKKRPERGGQFRGCLLLLDFTIATPIQQKLATAPPEVYLHHMPAQMGHMEIVEIMQPFDAVVRLSLRPAFSSRSTVLMEAAPERGKAVSMSLKGERSNNIRGSTTASTSMDGSIMARYVFRGDCPRPGQGTVLILPYADGEGLQGMLFEEPGLKMNSYTIVKSEHPIDPTKTRVSHMVETSLPDCSACVARPLLALAKFEQQSMQSSCEFQMPRAFKDIYTVLALRSCSRGLPMLPRALQAARVGEPLELEWVPVPEESFNFTSYFQDFVQALGHRVRVFGMVAGRLLVPYQAAIQRDEWALISESVEDVWQEHLSAYRRMRGGRTGPKLKTDVEPRYSELQPRSRNPDTVGASCSRQHNETVPVLVRHTFLHFMEESMLDEEDSPRSDIG